MSYLNLDKLGVCTSSICAMHCAAVPVLLFFTSSLGTLAFLANPIIELIILCFSIGVGAISIIPAIIRHRKVYVLVIFLAGTFLIVNSEFTELIWSKVASSTLGGALMAYAHYENWHLKPARS